MSASFKLLRTSRSLKSDSSPGRRRNFSKHSSQKAVFHLEAATEEADELCEYDLEALGRVHPVHM